MSREVRRVPIGWAHPVTYNEHWAFQASTPYGRSRPASRLHAPTERFVGLCDDYPGAVARWGEELRELEQREGRGWTFIVEYHLTGYQGRDDATPVVHPWYSYAADGETEVSTPVRDEDHLHELAVAQKQAEKPDPADYMPVFDVPEPELGWCLYETVSEGTPVTPVFATAEDLIDHLATVGQDHDQQPMRRASAETIVSTGGTIASMVVMGGTLYRSDVDADVLSERLA